MDREVQERPLSVSGRGRDSPSRHRPGQVLAGLASYPEGGRWREDEPHGKGGAFAPTWETTGTRATRTWRTVTPGLAPRTPVYGSGRPAFPPPTVLRGRGRIFPAPPRGPHRVRPARQFAESAPPQRSTGRPAEHQRARFRPGRTWPCAVAEPEGPTAECRRPSEEISPVRRSGQHLRRRPGSDNPARTGHPVACGAGSRDQDCTTKTVVQEARCGASHGSSTRIPAGSEAAHAAISGSTRTSRADTHGCPSPATCGPH
jgi:hypothetical protein